MLRLHFAGKLQVEYFADSARGEGHVLDISTIGCEIATSAFPLTVESIIDITIFFNAPKTTQKAFNTKAKVVRIDEGGFAVEYKEMNEEKKKELWQDLLLEFDYDLEVFPAKVV
jgi:hypothetical protein